LPLHARDPVHRQCRWLAALERPARYTFPQWRRAMTLETHSFFVGIAAVGGLLVVGFRGGILMGGVLVGGSKTPNKIERHAAAREPFPSTFFGLCMPPSLLSVLHICS
jgi:hypothetical protein